MPRQINLQPPSNLRGQFVGGNVNLQWVDNSEDEDSFTIERDVNNTGFQEIGMVGRNINSYIDRATSASQELLYRVRAKKDNLFSQYSNTLAIIVPPKAPLPPNPPDPKPPDPKPPENPKSSKNSRSSCYVATTTCGYNSDSTQSLKQFRSHYMKTNQLGWNCSQIYSGTSPAFCRVLNTKNIPHILAKFWVKTVAALPSFDISLTACFALIVLFLRKRLYTVLSIE